MYDMTREGVTSHKLTDEERAAWCWLYRFYGDEGAFNLMVKWR
jgi:hypothetical protein